MVHRVALNRPVMDVGLMNGAFSVMHGNTIFHSFFLSRFPCRIF